VTSKTAREFEPTKHVTSVSGRDYLGVKWRLVWLRSEHPNAVIETELQSLEKGFAVFKARVKTADGAEASGWGSEAAADFGDFIEKAETKALGRALAALGYGLQFCEDFDYAAEGARSQGGDDRASESQLRAIYSIGRAHGLGAEEVDDRSRKTYAGRIPSALGRREASGFIDALKAGAPSKEALPVAVKRESSPAAPRHVASDSKLATVAAG
jgi:hypothetical protein